ncbi:ATP-binding cassette domain-containing protein [Cedecea davisae]|uniref:ATP-binding cassette domain-containing protein n=1 Tax=Cedecea davisae TaxID=158484 RepID=UPI00376EB8B5
MRSIEVLGLFGRLDYKIKCNENEIIIITGPNGYGKTTLLKIIKSVYSNNYDMFAGLNFKKITIKFQNGNSVEIVKDNENVKVKIEDIIKEQSFDFLGYYYNQAKSKDSEEVEFFKNGKTIKFNIGAESKKN